MKTIEEFESHLKHIKGYAEKTIEVYLKYVKTLNENNNDYRKIMTLISGNSNNTKRVALSAIKSYYRYVGDLRVNEIELPKKNSNILPHVTYEEYCDILSNINKKPKKKFMKYIIVRLLFETGVRASELLSIKKSDIIDNQIVVNGKGSSQRIINLSNNLITELNKYLLNITTDKIFNFGYKNLYKKIKNIENNKKLTPHMFRRGYAKFCYSKGVSIYDISLSMGHNDINTTAIYIKRKSEDVNITHIFS
ncbi:MAG: tyrosine-type recombinase/integrase [Mycoplasmataceae bacterium]|nr:tyrosine-type recombinase/integrase [Mycoplasmataceae bacterium]